MSKATLEFDAPESCAGCNLTGSGFCCMGTTEAITDYTTSRHPDCPLRIEEDKCVYCGNGTATSFSLWVYCPQCGKTLKREFK